MKKIIFYITLFCIFVLTASSSFALNFQDNNSTENSSATKLKTADFKLIGKMHIPKVSPAAIELSSGKIFIAGGMQYINKTGTWKETQTTEIFDINTKKSTSGPNMNYPRREPSLFELKDGRVLIFGGEPYETKLPIEIYNPKTNTIIAVPSTEREYRKNRYFYYIATYLNDEEVLISSARGLNSRSFVFNTRTNEMKKFDFPNSRFFENGHFLTKQNDYLYFIKLNENAIFRISISNPDSFDKSKDVFSNKQYFAFTSPYPILLKDKKTVAVFNERAMYFFDTSNNTFYGPKISEPHDLGKIKKMFLLNNSNILIYSFNPKWIVSEFNIKTRKSTHKRFETPLYTGAHIMLKNDMILYFGGTYNKRPSNGIYVLGR